MNERIKELEAQCWETRKNLVSQAAMGDKFNTEKFAELIVRECIDLCELWNVTPGSRLAEEIKKQFGVE